ncbi:MAG: HAD-IC family P-type ATPase [Candidatus Diapherotrites archaeon]|uniref:HAD-IC family P-type ATPase n=1 Tax=Candidatus Iainarchaeum sp. TaxID=3101447 RepID=A0A8T5GDH4_9ARCH|nr:HAD-IC family P-type ATPase [Candidatus Diapherotrites archaeon]MBT7241588.1 HAD-IC family P-type ATPase [Candidatus Diapherotrites archaeon]
MINKDFLISNNKLFDLLKSTPEGISAEESTKRIEKHGYNELEQKKNFSAIKILISQFTSYLVIILIVAGIISFLLGEYLDAIGIFFIVVLNGVIGFFQEYKAENTMEALKKMVSEKTVVIRNGKKELIESKYLVPGDIVFLDEGSKVPADIRIIENYSLKVDESMLTGESLSVTKKVLNKVDQKNYKEGSLFSGTLIVSGSATGVVYSTAMDTEFGKIADLVNEEENEETQLDHQMNLLAKKLGKIILIIIILLFILGFFRGIDLVEMFMISVSLGVSAIPEGLPIVITLTLAMGILAISRKKALVRKMSVIESLGAATVICSDKTGTLTVNEMTVKNVYCEKEINIPGEGFDAKEHFKAPKSFFKLLDIGNNCNNSFVEFDKKGIHTKIVGDPTELALKVLGEKASHFKEYKKLNELPFTSDRKMMSTVHKINGKNELFAKGAPEVLIPKCSRIIKDGRIVKLTDQKKKELLALNNKWGKEALRVLAFAYKEVKDKKGNEKDLIFVGLAGMIDPPRQEVKLALKKAQDAGIEVKIITGDNALTAKAIAESIGLTVTGVVEGYELEKMSDKKLKEILPGTNLFARTNPKHKYRIVSLLEEMGEVVAVTGDGVNDAPALKKADVGIAMGIKGTQVSKEASDIVLEDDNFATIINIIEEGRRVYSNILSFVKFMLSANFDTITVVALATLVGLPLPILPLQVLWINIATDSLPALALGTETAEKGIMKKKPHKKGESIIKKFIPFLSLAVITQVIANGVVLIYGFHLDAINGINTLDLAIPSFARTLFFTEIVIFELLLVFNCRGIKKSLLRGGLFENKKLIVAVLISFLLQLFIIYSPFAQTFFKTIPLGLDHWFILIILALPAIVIPQVIHLLHRKGIIQTDA